MMKNIHQANTNQKKADIKQRALILKQSNKTKQKPF